MTLGFEMDTYVLVGDPGKKDGMRGELWENQYEQHLREGSALTTWSMKAQNTPAGTQVVVVRTGAVKRA
jgi:hypothetical protein